MSTITFSYRNEKAKSSRTKINNIDLKKSVTEFKSNVSRSIGLPSSEIDIVYCGRCLREEESLEMCGMKPGCTVYVLKKQAAPKQHTPEPVSWHQVITAVKSALQCPAYRTTVKRMLSDRDALENLISSVPGLDKDMAVLSMLHSPSLLSSLIHPDNIHKVLANHPCFGQAAIIVAAAVNEDSVRESTATTQTDSYSLDQMSDDDDVMSEPSQAGNMPAGASGASQGITASQLSVALAMATGMSPGRSSSSSQATQSNSGSSISTTPPMITSDFFRQAMQQATQQAGGTSSESDIQGQLQQLREMGIEDENVARRALEATGGDLLAALNLIFADENM